MHLIVFTDLDGSLLNEDDYRYDGATDAIGRLRSLNVPLGLASSKTLAEMRPLAAELQTNAPIIFENGGGIAWTDGTIESTCVDRESLLEELDRLRSAGFRFESFRDLGVEGVMRTTGLDAGRTELALDRHATEPLLWQDTEDRKIDFCKQLNRKGLHLVRGGRFYHVSGPIDKAKACQMVCDRIDQRSDAVAKRAPIHTIAVGDSPNDAAMLTWASTAILVPGPEGLKFDLKRPDVRVAASSGSHGWGEAVTMAIEELKLG